MWSSTKNDSAYTEKGLFSVKAACDSGEVMNASREEALRGDMCVAEARMYSVTVANADLGLPVPDRAKKLSLEALLA